MSVSVSRRLLAVVLSASFGAFGVAAPDSKESATKKSAEKSAEKTEDKAKNEGEETKPAKKPAAKADAKSDDKSQSEADKTLTEKGLKWKAGRFYLDAHEKAAEDAFKEYLTKIKPKYITADKSMQKLEKSISAITRHRRDLQSKIEAVEKALEGFVGNQKRDELTRQLAQLKNLDSVAEKEFSIASRQMAEHRNKFNELLETRIGELQKIRKVYADAQTEYRKIVDDKAAKEAVDVVQKEDAKRKGKLAPTESFVQLDAKLRREENMLIPDVIPLEQIGGGNGWFLNINFGDNSASMQKFHLDTGADGVTMPWRMAMELGLAPDKSERRAAGRLASGEIATGVVVKCPLCKVGRFEVKDFEVFVFDSRYPDAAALFGIELMNGFRWYIDPENKTLTVVEREGAEPKPKPKAGAEPKKDKPAKPEGKPAAEKPAAEKPAKGKPAAKESADEESDDEPAPPKKKSAKKAPSKVEEEGDEDEAPVAKPKKAKKPAAEDDAEESTADEKDE